MNTRNLLSGILAVMIAVSAVADEKPAFHKFNTVLKEINEAMKETERAKARIQAKQDKLKKSKDVLPNVKENWEKLEKALESYPAEPNESETRGIEVLFLECAKADVNYVEARLGELNPGIMILNETEKGCKKVVFGLDQLSELATKLDPTDPNSQVYIETERHIVGVAEIIDSVERLACAPTEEMKRLRDTLDMLAGIELSNNASMQDLVKHLETRKKEFEHILAQTSLAKRSLLRQKNILARIAQGRVVQNMLLRLGMRLGMGMPSITDFAKSFQESNERSIQNDKNFSEAGSQSLSPPTSMTPASRRWYRNLKATRNSFESRNR